MGDLGDYWREAKEYRWSHGAISNQYWSEKQRERGTTFKNACNYEEDERQLAHLTELGLQPVKKNTHSFQININGRIGMYYCGRNEKIRFNDGEIVELPCYNSLKKYLGKDGDVSH